MSHNDQMEKNIAFHCCAKMVGWLHLHSAPHILLHQINKLERFWRYTVVPIVPDAVWGCLGVSEGESWCIWVVFCDVKTAWESLGVYLRAESMQNWAVPNQTHHFSTTLKCKIFYASSSWDIKIPKPPHKCFLKIIGLGHFWYFLSSSERNYL